MHDLRYAFRMMFKNPGFTLVVLLTLGLGIGANTAIFSIVNQLLLQPLPYGNPERIVMVWQDFSKRTGRKIEWTSPDNFFDWRDQNQVFEGISILDGWLPTIGGAEPEQISGARVSYNMFSVLGISPALGRSFVQEEDTPNGPKAIILSDGLWRRRFGGDRKAVGKDLLIDGESYNIIGVMSADFEFPMEPSAELWTTMQVDSTNSCGRGCITLRSIARLKPNVSIERAQSEMNVIAKRLEQQYPEENRAVGIILVPLQQQLTEEIRPALFVLLAAVGFVLMIACANIANLLLARSSKRRTEIAVRTALGANKLRLTQQLMTETILLALIGGTIGILIGYQCLEILLALIPADLQIIGLKNVSIDTTVLAFTFGVSILTGIIFGFMPIIHFNDPKLGESLKEGGRTRTQTGGSRIRSVLVVSEVAFALMLLICAGLLMKSFIRLLNVNPGFRPENILTMQLNLPQNRYSEREQIIPFFSQLLERVKQIPGVLKAGTTSSLPMGGSYTDTGFLLEGQSPEDRPSQGVWFQIVSKDYLQTLGIQLLKGRHFTEQDDLNAPRVVIVSESFARRYFPNGDVLGKRLNFNDPARPMWREIIGVAADVKQFALNREVPIALYFHNKQSASPFVTLVVQTSKDPVKMAADIRAQVWSLDKNLAVSDIQTMEQVVSSTVTESRVTLILIGAFAVAALLLAGMGLYGVISYSTSQRTNEIGIRMALGADRRTVLQMIVKQGIYLTSIGIALGLTGAIALTRLMNQLLFGITATDPYTYIVISVLLAGIAVIASYIPAHRASRVDPVIALRYE